MSQTPRHINTSRSLNRPDPAAAAPRHAASSTDAKQSAGGAHNEPPRRPAQGAGQKPPRRRKKKKKMPLWLPFAVVMAIIAVISGVVVYGVSLVNKVEDSIRPDDSTPTIEEEVKTAEEYKGDVVNILVCGIDYEEGRNYSNDPTSNDGMTDMILYVQFDIKNNYGGYDNAGHVGLSEVQFFTRADQTVVPEPSTALLLGIGLGGLAFACRRPRRR